MKLLLLAAALFVSVQAIALRIEGATVAGDGAAEFARFVRTYNKTYGGADEVKKRHGIFADNLRWIRRYTTVLTPRTGMKVAINEFADMTPKEFASLYTMRRKIDATTARRTGEPLPRELFAASTPASIDWRTHGYVTPVKNQGQCGSCYSFSATGSMEGQHFKLTNQLVGLSEKNIMDCSWEQGDNGCGGGLMDNAFKYVKDNGGIDKESAYPYEPVSSHNCQYSASERGACVSGYHDVQKDSEAELQVAVGNVGPVSIAIDASRPSFMFYSSGVYYDATCSSTQLDHGVLAVGYGVDSANGKKYWIVKNSWGSSWGMSGYIWMSRDRGNNCGVASMASYPVASHC